MKHGFVKVAAAVPAVRVADTKYNVEQMFPLIDEAERNGVEIMVFPELGITGYSCNDLFRQDLLLDKAEDGLLKIVDYTRKLNVVTVVGLPIRIGSLLYNCAAVVQQGSILGVITKTYLPNYNEFYEKRWFASSSDLLPQSIYLAGNLIDVSNEPLVFQTPQGVRFGVEICEDLWAPLPPSNNLALAGADIIVNLSATTEVVGKHRSLIALLKQQSARTMSTYVYCSCGFGESSGDVVYGGNAIICENGNLLAEGKRFSFEPQLKIAQTDIEVLRAERQNNTTFRTAQDGAHARVVFTKPVGESDFELMRYIEPHPFIPKEEYMEEECEEMFNIQVAGLARRLEHTFTSKVVIGISGGLDSTLALMVAVGAFKRLGLPVEGIIGITMPGFGTSSRTHDNALQLMQSLGITVREISIKEAVLQHFSDIGHDAAIHDVTYENSQARERTQLLMDIANKEGGLVVGTGDMSELALGWCTYNGDHMSMYGVNAGVPKTLAQFLIRHIAASPEYAGQRDTLLDVVDTPISPELTPTDSEGKIDQKTENLIGPYELHDFFLYYMVSYGFRPHKLVLMAGRAFGEKYSLEEIKKWLTIFCRRFFTQQFKRSCLPEGPKVTTVSLSPRGDWRMPSDATAALWLEEISEC